MRYSFRDKYYNPDGTDVIATGQSVLFCYPFTAGDGTRENPTNVLVKNMVNILANGVYRFSGVTTGRYENFYAIGHGKANTVLIDFLCAHNDDRETYRHFKDLHLIRPTFTTSNTSPSLNFVFSNVIIDGLQSALPSNFKLTSKHSLFKKVVSSIPNIQTASINNSFYNGWYTMLGNLSLFNQCDIIVSQSTLTTYLNSYLAFNNCRFRMGNEADYAILTPKDVNGTVIDNPTEPDFRNEFVKRCTDAGLTVPAPVTELGETLYMYRWVFANNAAIEGAVLPNSIIHTFEQRRSIYFGYTSMRNGFFVSATNLKNSFNPFNPHENFVINNNSISLPDDVDISLNKTAYIDSNIMWLGGKKSIGSLEILQTFPKEFGVNVDTTKSLNNAPVSEITGYENGLSKLYIVRSNNTDLATVTYNGVTYTSSLYTKKNIIKSVNGKTAFTASENAEVYEIIDELQYQTLQVRVVNKIPGDIITAGMALLSGYWYFVEHNYDQTNKTDYIGMNGIKFYAGDSFVVPDVWSWEVVGAIHLRRLWHKNFDLNTETTDKSFWQNIQKPEWMDVVDDDPRCFFKNNNPASDEVLKASDGKYMASGHPEFYSWLVGLNGIPQNGYQIRGVYIQFRVVLTTLNPL